MRDELKQARDALTDKQVEDAERFAFASTNETPVTPLCKHWYRKGLRDGLAVAAADAALSAQPEPVAYMHSVENDAGDQDYALSFAPDNFPLKGIGGFRSVHVQPLYAQPVAAPAQPAKVVDEQKLKAAVDAVWEHQVIFERMSPLDRAEFHEVAGAVVAGYLDAAPAQPVAGEQALLTDEKVLELRSKHGWAKETIRAIEAAIRTEWGAQPVAGEPDALTDAARDVLAERRRQVKVEGWTPKHDDEHGNGEMALAAAAYAVVARTDAGPREAPAWWPWDPEWWKPRDERRNLVRAAALLLAEIEIGRAHV